MSLGMDAVARNEIGDEIQWNEMEQLSRYKFMGVIRIDESKWGLQFPGMELSAMWQ